MVVGDDDEVAAADVPDAGRGLAFGVQHLADARSGEQDLADFLEDRRIKDDDVRDLRRMLGRRDGVRTHLVIPADTSVSSAKRIVERFADTQPDRVVVSPVNVGGIHRRCCSSVP